MADGGDADRLAPLGQLIENPIGADSQRVEAPKFPAQGVTGERIALQ